MQFWLMKNLKSELNFCIENIFWWFFLCVWVQCWWTKRIWKGWELEKFLLAMKRKKLYGKKSNSKNIKLNWKKKFLGICAGIQKAVSVFCEYFDGICKIWKIYLKNVEILAFEFRKTEILLILLNLIFRI